MRAKVSPQATDGHNERDKNKRKTTKQRIEIVTGFCIVALLSIQRVRLPISAGPKPEF
jgi:hypothetical protein